MYVVKSIMLALVAMLTFGAVTASATTTHPLFLTQSGRALKFTALGVLPLLRVSETLISCEKSTISGEVLNKSTLVDKVEMEFSGKCSNNEECPPIKVELARGELGLLTSTTKTVALLLVPETGTVFINWTCGGTLVAEGAIVAEIPEFNSKSEALYNKDRKTFELRFETENKTSKQKIKEIFLLGTQITGVQLLYHLFGQVFNVSIEDTETLTTDGETLIDTK